MNWYRIRLTPLSPALTPWQADTLVGHFAWEVVRREGEEALGRFLSTFEEGHPPFVLSDGFPGDFLPAPLSLPWLYEDEGAGRKAAGHRWLTLEEFNAVRAGQPPPELPDRARRDPWQIAVTAHVTLSRSTLTSGEEGSLYALEGFLPCAPGADDGKPAPVTFYALVEDEPAARRLRSLFECLSEVGYGKRKSVGYGAFRLVEMEPFLDFDRVPVAEADALVALANFVPAADDPAEGLWQTDVKHGRLGEERALRPQPFKRPFRFLRAGSVFRTGEWPRRKSWIGRTLRGLSTNPDDPGRPGDDRQVCLAPVLPCVWPKSLGKGLSET